MKKIKKILISLLIAVTVCGVFTATALASEGKGAQSESIFESAFSLVYENSDELFSALAFLGTIIMAIFYKRGLTPTLSRGISRISTAVSEVKKACGESNTLSGLMGDKITERLGCLENSLESFSTEIIRLEEMLGTEAELKDERERMRKILSFQIDMLSELFMTSALPQYRKDAVGERVRAMREALSENAEEQR